MKEGKISELARSQARSLVIVASVSVLVCVVVLAFNWKYVYNWIAGPVPFTAALATNPGAHEFVSVKGNAQPTGLNEESTLKYKGKVPLSKTVTAEYITVQVEAKKLLVQAPPGYDKNVLAGRLVPIPAELARAVPVDAEFYPWMLEAKTGYRWDFNLLVLGATLLLPFASCFLLLFFWRVGNLERTPAIAELRRFGAPREVLEKIEADVAKAGEHQEVGPLITTPTWLIISEPALTIFAVDEIAGIARSVEFKKKGAASVHSMLIWLYGRPLPEKTDLGEAVVGAAMQKIASLYPWLPIENPKEFGAKWSNHREDCEQQAKQRKPATAIVAS
jgi:hypothetical protein